MDEMKLGYTKKWIEYSFLDEDILSSQVAEFEKGDDQSAEHYRYTSFVNWLEGKEKLTDQEVSNYIELAHEDVDDRMSGLAMKNLFISPKISNEQFEMIKIKLPKFGEWTQKLISREVLIRRLNDEELTSELFSLCFDYKTEFNDNRLLIHIIQKTDNVDVLSLFSGLEIGKKIKTLAKNRLNQLVKARNIG